MNLREKGERIRLLTIDVRKRVSSVETGAMSVISVRSGKFNDFQLHHSFE